MKKNLIYCLFIIVAFMVNGCNMETPQQKAQKEFDRVMLETKRKAERQKAEADSLLKIVTNDYQTMYERVKALDELKEKYAFFRKYTDNELLHLLDKD